MGLRGQTGLVRGVDAGDERLDLGADVWGEDGKLPERRLAEADAAREAVDAQGLLADELGERAARRPQPQLELKGAVLRLGEAEPEPGVFLGRRRRCGGCRSCRDESSAAWRGPRTCSVPEVTGRRLPRRERRSSRR